MAETWHTMQLVMKHSALVGAHLPQATDYASSKDKQTVHSLQCSKIIEHWKVKLVNYTQAFTRNCPMLKHSVRNWKDLEYSDLYLLLTFLHIQISF